MLNKSDLLTPEEFAERREAVLSALEWEGPVYEISAISGEGTQRLCQDMMELLEQQRALEAEDPELAEQEFQSQVAMQQEARERIAELRARRRSQAQEADDDEDDDDYDVEVEYAP